MFGEEHLLISFESWDDDNVLADYEKALIDSGFKVFSLKNGAPKEYHTVYHKYHSEGSLVELTLRYQKNILDLEKIKIEAVKYRYGKIENGVLDQSLISFSSDNDFPFTHDGLYLFYDVFAIKWDDHNMMPATYVKGFGEPSGDDYYPNLLAEQGYLFANDIHPTTSSIYYQAGASNTSQINYSTNKMMDEEGFKEIEALQALMINFEGFPTSLLSAALSYQLPNLNQVSAQVLFVGQLSSSSPALFFKTLDVNAFKNVLSENGWESSGPSSMSIFADGETKEIHIIEYPNYYRLMAY